MSSSNPNVPNDDLRSKHKEHVIIPSSILTKTDNPIVVILTPELSETYAEIYWHFLFNKLACKFQILGAHTIAIPWSKAPLNADSSLPSMRYVANLVWGYHTIVDRWIKWLHAWPKEVMLINSPSLLLWNTRKTYLQELEKAGIPIIPTLYVEYIDEETLINAATQFATSDLIVKPQVSASGFNMFRVLVNSLDFAASPKSLSVTAAIDELNRLNAVHSLMMIQPFMPNVVHEGEISVLMFAGQLSHVVQKNTSPDDYRVQQQYGGIVSAVDQPSVEIMDLAYATLAACPETPIYARVDMIRNHLTGSWCLSELELIEPDLLLNQAADGGLAFARAILQVRS